MNKAIKDLCAKLQDAEKGRIEVRQTISFVSDNSYQDSSKDKSKFINVMHMHNPATKDIKANNYQVNVRKFDDGSPKDVLL